MKWIDLVKFPQKIIFLIGIRGGLRFFNDEDFLRLMYWCRFNRRLDLNNPQTFNEKLQWLKLYYRKSEFTTLVDKYEVKEYVANKIGKQYVVPTLGIWENFNDINFEKLPSQFVLKCTHDSGGLVVCKDKKMFNRNLAQNKIKKSLKRNYFYCSREWPYKDVKPRIIAEKYMKNGKNENLDVYKIFNFNGVPKIIQTIQNDKMPNETIDYFDVKWKLLKLRQNYPNSEHPLPKPEELDEMLSLARKLSEGYPFIRTDFYVVNGKVYFSEFTFYSDAGMAEFSPREWDNAIGEWLILPKL